MVVVVRPPRLTLGLGGARLPQRPTRDVFVPEGETEASKGKRGAHAPPLRSRPLRVARGCTWGWAGASGSGTGRPSRWASSAEPDCGGPVLLGPEGMVLPAGPAAAGWCWPE